MAKLGLRELLHRFHILHGLYKFSRIIAEVPLREWLEFHRTISVIQVLPNTMLSARRLLNAYDCMVTVEDEGIKGSVAECGVWSGGSIGLMASAAKRHGDQSRAFHLFDSFEGLPQPSTHDVEVLPTFRNDHPAIALDDGRGVSLVAIGACRGASLPKVKELFEDVLTIRPNQVVIHQGWFQDTVPVAAQSIEPLAILRLDGDWYQSTKVCLEALFDKVVPGGFVIIDDYGAFSGCRKATDEFLQARRLKPNLVDIDGVGMFFRKPQA